MPIRKRLSKDINDVEKRLKAAGLPLNGLDLTEGWVVESEDRILGHVAIEVTEEAVVIRSLVVDPSEQGKGFGAILIREAEASAGKRKIVLKTDTIGPWMEDRGYRQVTLAEVPASVSTTTQFSGTLCSGTPVYLKETVMEAHSNAPAVREQHGDFIPQKANGCGLTTKRCGCSGSFEDPS